MLLFYLRLYLFLYFILKVLNIHLGNTHTHMNSHNESNKKMHHCILEVKPVSLGFPASLWHNDSKWRHFRSQLVHWEVCRMRSPLLLDLSLFSPRKPLEKYQILSTTVSQRPSSKSTWEETWVCLSLVCFLFSDCNFTSLVCFYKLWTLYVCMLFLLQWQHKIMSKYLATYSLWECFGSIMHQIKS